MDLLTLTTLESEMNEVKSLFASKTFWGALVAVAAGVLGLFGYTVTPEDEMWLVDSIAGVAAIAGGLVAVYGRIRTSKRIG